MSKYDEKSIERFAGLAGIRKKPTPYIGPTDGDGLWTIWREPADNAVDQALAGRNDVVHLIFDPEPNVYWVLDAGPGIPVGKKEFEDEKGKREVLSTFYVATGLTHGGSNFSGNTISRGTHGIGIKATNAMSKSFKVWTFRDGKWYCIEYKDARLSKDVYESKPPKLPHGIKAKRGTVVRFEPDMTLFRKGAAMSGELIRDWCQLTAYLVPKLKVRFTNKKGTTKELVTKGPGEYIDKYVADNKLTQTGKIFTFSSKEADVAVAFTDAEGSDLVKAYTNGLYNKEGGEHLDALMSGLAKSLVPYSKKDKKGRLKYTPSDLRDGLIGLVNYKISAPQFNNQPKDKLIDERVSPVAVPQFTAAWAAFWKEHQKMAKQIVARAETLREKTADFLKDKKLLKNVNAAKKKLSTKLAAIEGNAPVEERELFIVEGDSAGGGAKVMRNKKTQAVYPMRGKLLNVMDNKKEKINNNAEVSGLLAAIGADEKGKKDKRAVFYGKHILMPDPDVDGYHIGCLGLAVFQKFRPDLIESGHVFMVKAPLYKCRHKGQVHFGMTKDELYEKLKTKNLDITYIKGWGEIDVEDLGIAMDPNVRQLYKVLPQNKKGKFEALMSNAKDFRKKLLGVA